MSRALTVWWDDGEVGELALNDRGAMIFRYAKTWLENPRAPAISVSLPKQVEAFNRARTRPFFAGLLPEEKPRTEAAQAPQDGPSGRRGRQRTLPRSSAA